MQQALQAHRAVRLSRRRLAQSMASAQTAAGGTAALAMPRLSRAEARLQRYLACRTLVISDSDDSKLTLCAPPAAAPQAALWLRADGASGGVCGLGLSASLLHRLCPYLRADELRSLPAHQLAALCSGLFSPALHSAAALLGTSLALSAAGERPPAAATVRLHAQLSLPSYSETLWISVDSELLETLQARLDNGACEHRASLAQALLPLSVHVQIGHSGADKPLSVDDLISVDLKSGAALRIAPTLRWPVDLNADATALRLGTRPQPDEATDEATDEDTDEDADEDTDEDTDTDADAIATPTTLAVDAATLTLTVDQLRALRPGTELVLPRPLGPSLWLRRGRQLVASGQLQQIDQTGLMMRIAAVYRRY